MTVSTELSGVCTMDWIPLLFFLLHCTGCFSQPVLTQSPTASATLGASVKLTCTLSSDYSTFTIYWYQQQADKAPKYLMFVNSAGNHGKGNGVPDRFSGSSSGAHRYLSISNIQPEDEADYFCGVDYRIRRQSGYVFGSGTELTVLGQPKSAPKITVFPPSSEELQTNKATVVCLINDFSPRTITVAWEADDVPITQGVQTTKPSKESTNYMASSYLSLTADQWKSYKSVSCRVTHEGSLVEKSLSPAQCS